MHHIDVRLAKASSPGTLLVEILDPMGRIETQTVEIPQAAPIELEKAYRLWLAAFTRHITPCEVGAAAGHSTAALEDRERKLIARMKTWLREPGWRGWHEALKRSDLAIRLSFSGLGEASWLEKLPWEGVVPSNRVLWRGCPDSPLEGIAPVMPMVRRPRLLVIMGDEQELPLKRDFEVLRSLEHLGRAQLTVLRGQRCTKENLEENLTRKSFDALIFLGHSREDQWEGGWIELGDGQQVSGEALAEALKVASREGLQLALLSSCSGIPLAKKLIGCGLDWVVCFRELVPTQTATEALIRLLEEMQKGQTLEDAIRLCRERLKEGEGAGGAFQASVYSRYGQGECRLPLSRGERLWQRLKSSPRAMMIPTGVALVLSMFSEWPELNMFQPQMMALNWRMALQQWAAPGKLIHPPPGQERSVAILVVDEKDYTTHDALCAAKGSGALVSHDLLARILDAVNESDVRLVGIDYELKEEVVKGSEENRPLNCGPTQGSPLEVLSTAVRQFTTSAPNRKVVAVHSADSLDCHEAPPKDEWTYSPKQDQLKRNGVDFASACLPVGGTKSGVRLRSPLKPDDRAFAYAVSNLPGHGIPRNAVIDWTIDWSQRIRPVPTQDRSERPRVVEELQNLKSEVLIIGSEGFRRRPGQGGETEALDRWQAPWPVGQQDKQTWDELGLKNNQIPGVVVQAVFNQSIRDRHWIRPLPYLLVVGVIVGAGGLGIVLSSVSENRWLLLLMASSIVACHVWIAIKAFSDHQLLVPIVLPTAVIITTPFTRRRCSNA